MLLNAVNHYIGSVTISPQDQVMITDPDIFVLVSNLMREVQFDQMTQISPKC